MNPLKPLLDFRRDFAELVTAVGATPGMSIVADIAFGWVPRSAPVRIDARYQFSRQFTIGEDTTGELFPAIQRHTVLLGTTFAYPGTPEAGGAAPFVRCRRCRPTPTSSPTKRRGPSAP